MYRVPRLITTLVLSIALVTIHSCAREPTPGNIASQFMKHIAAGEVDEAMPYISSRFNLVGEDKMRDILQMEVSLAREMGELEPNLEVEVVSEEVDGDFAKVLLETTSETGSVSEVPFELVREEEEWKVIVEEDGELK